MRRDELEPREQLVISAKAPSDRSGDAPRRPTRARRAKILQEGRTWQRKMHSLALRLPKRRARRDRSGAPMKRG